MQEMGLLNRRSPMPVLLVPLLWVVGAAVLSYSPRAQAGDDKGVLKHLALGCQFGKRRAKTSGRNLRMAVVSPGATLMFHKAAHLERAGDHAPVSVGHRRGFHFLVAVV